MHYLSHITGHGLLKLMRPQRELTYRIERLPEVPAVLALHGRAGRPGRRAAYSTFNMGAGFAVYCAAGAGAEVVASRRGIRPDARWSPGRWRRGRGRYCSSRSVSRYEGAELELSA